MLWSQRATATYDEQRKGEQLASQIGSLNILKIYLTKKHIEDLFLVHYNRRVPLGTMSSRQPSLVRVEYRLTVRELQQFVTQIKII